MGVMKKVYVLLLASVVGFVGVANAATAPQVVSGFDNSARVFDYVEESDPIPAWALCSRWWDMLRNTGWVEADVRMADFVIHRESRCDETQVNSDDPVRIGKHKGSFGLFQINLFWISKTTAYPKGYLQTVLGRNLKPTDLLNPSTNAEAAQAIIAYNRANGGCGWQAWAWKGC